MFEASKESDPQEGLADDVIVYIIVEAVIAFFALCSNSLVLAAICKFKNLQTTTYKLIGSLAVADMAVALLANPSGILLRLNLSIKSEFYNNETIDSFSLDQEVCSLFICLVLILTQVSIWNLLAIAIDRHIAIHHSLRYKALVTSVRLKLCIAATWICSVIAITPHMDWYVNDFLRKNESDQQLNTCTFEDQITLRYMVICNFFAFMLSPLLIMFILYYFIFKTAKAQLRKIYQDVLTLNKKSKLSLTSLKDILNIKEQMQQESPQKHVPLRKHIFRVTKKLFRSKTDASYKVGEAAMDSSSSSSGKSDNNNKGLFAQPSSTNDFVSEVSMTSQKKDSFDSASFGNSRTSSFSHDLSVADPKPKEANLYLTPGDRSHRNFSTGSNLTTTTLNTSETDIRKKKLKRKSQYLKKEFRAARSLFIVLGAFAVCWLPVHVHNAIHYFNPLLEQPLWFADFAIILSHANSLVNPVIYAFQLKEMRTAFKKLFIQSYHSVKSIFCSFISKSTST